MKEFTIVLCDDDTFRKHYKKAQNIEVINHKDILLKLENNDIYKKKPTTAILKFFIINRIKKSIDSQKIETIFYKVDDISLDLIQSLKLVMGVYFNKVVLNLITQEDIDTDDIKKYFKEIVRIG
jgi:hypothetical protein